MTREPRPRMCAGWLAVILTAMVAVVVLSGCGGSPEARVAEVAEPDTQPAEAMERDEADEPSDATGLAEQIPTPESVLPEAPNTEMGMLFEAIAAVRNSATMETSPEEYRALLDTAESAIGTSTDTESEALGLLAEALEMYNIAYQAWRIKGLDVLQSNRSWREFTTEHYNIISTLGLSTLVVSDEDIDLILEHLWGEASALVSRAEDAR